MCKSYDKHGYEKAVSFRVCKKMVKLKNRGFHRQWRSIKLLYWENITTNKSQFKWFRNTCFACNKILFFYPQEAKNVCLQILWLNVFSVFKETRQYMYINSMDRRSQIISSSQTNFFIRILICHWCWRCIMWHVKTVLVSECDNSMLMKLNP